MNCTIQKAVLKVGLLFLLAIGISSCGGNGSQPLTPTSIPIVLAQLSTVLNQLPKSNTMPALPVTGITTAAASLERAGTDCETTTPSSPVDGDSDGIALTKTGTFSCTSQSSGASTYTRAGSYTVKDLDDTVAGMMGGVRVEYNISKFNYVDNSDGSSGEGAYQGFWNYEQKSGSLISTSDFNGHHVFLNPAFDYDVNYDYHYDWNWKMTPTNLGSPWVSGVVEFEGNYDLSGKFMTEDASGNHKTQEGTWSVQYYSKDMKYDSTCTKWYQSGSMFIKDGQGSLLEIRYACTSAKLYVDGAESNLWTP